MNKISKGWYVLYVRSQHEKKVDFRLKEYNIDSFLPMVITIRQWSDRKKKVQSPLFPSYIFVNINSPLEFYKVLSVNGTCAYITFGTEYAKVPEKEINKIKFLVGSKDITDIETNVCLPKIGEIKKISWGTLKGLKCEVLKINNKRKVIVRLDSLQQIITAEVPINLLE